jgi:tripartite-type tricarboxylate transporter receptor subunit TctC
MSNMMRGNAMPGTGHAAAARACVSRATALFVAYVACVAHGVQAQALSTGAAFPVKPIRMVAPFPPGGSVDNTARLIVPSMSESLGQNVVIDNRSGASGNIGMEYVARAPADGYTLLINTVPTVANPALFKLSFVPERDFAPISLVMNGPNVLVVHPSLPVRNVKAFVALAKARPGDIKYTSAGAGTLPHLGMALLSYMTKINLLHVAYKGGGPALVALVAGECDASMYTLLSASGHLASGRLRAIGVTGKTRFNALPDVPTLAESGVPGYEFNAWVGVLAPAATPPAIIRLLNEHVVKAARSPVAAERLARDGAEVVASTPEAFRARIAADTALWAKVIKEMNLRAE